MTSGKLTGFTALLITAVLSGQQPAGAQFEVVSIHKVPPNAPTVMREFDFTPILPGGQYRDSMTNLLVMIANAYNVRFPGMQLRGLPNWASNQAFAVAAKPAPDFPTLPPAENKRQVQLMLRQMLADRFHLQIHSENQQGKVFRLEVAKGGFKIKEAEPPHPPAKETPVGAAFGNDGGHMVGDKSTMATFAGALTIMLKQPVTDATGLKGYYDFDVKWSAPESPDKSPPGFGAEGVSLLISALRDQFGLRLTETDGSTEVWVVDHVEPPSEN